MPHSQIKLVEVDSGREIPAAPDNLVLLTSAKLGWSGITVELHDLAPMELPEHFVEGHRLMVAMQAGQPIPFEWKNNGRWKQKLLKPGDFSLQTHGDVNAPRWNQNLKILAIALEPKFIGTVFQNSLPSENISFYERRCETDPVISRFGEYFINELKDSTYTGKLYGESLGMAFALHLLEKHGNLTKSVKMPSGKLASAQLRRTLEFIHANLSEDLSIEQLANQAYLSPFHFARLFKQTLGMSPHQYVLQNRIERAKRLIAKSPYFNLTEIGLSVGFFDQSHFSKSFKRVTGTTPKVFLKQAA